MDDIAAIARPDGTEFEMAAPAFKRVNDSASITTDYVMKLVTFGIKRQPKALITKSIPFVEDVCWSWNRTPTVSKSEHLIEERLAYEIANLLMPKSQLLRERFDVAQVYIKINC